jgi:hypothetical protein
MLRSDVAALLYRLPADLRAVVKKDIRAMKQPDAQKAHVEMFGGLMTPTMDQAAYFADQKAERAHAERSRPGGVKTAQEDAHGPAGR